MDDTHNIQLNNIQLNNNMILKFLKKLEKETLNKLEEKKKLFNQGNCCVGCGEKNNQALILHHLSWDRNKGFPKSDKKSETIRLCYNCHHLIHGSGLLGIGFDDETIKDMIRIERKFNPNSTKQIKNFLTKVFIARHQPEDLLEGTLFNLIFLRGEI